MYGRWNQGRRLNFEASGGLMHASLVMQDKETDSYWSIMTKEAVAGDLTGSKLHELPYGQKMQWKQWVRLHPETRVLSVDGVEHIENSPYDNYFARETSYGNVLAEDDRLETKDPIYAFEWEGRQYAVPHSSFFEGGVFELGEGEIFLYRPTGVAIFYSTKAFFSKHGFRRRSGAWYIEGSEVPFDPESGSFGSGSETPRWLEGFDTFWFNWSMAHPNTEVLDQHR